MNLTDLFDLTLKGRAEEPALEYRGGHWTFGELDSHSNRIAHYLRARGLEAGDRLAVYLPNSVELIVAYLAAIKLGVVFTPINALYRGWEIGHILSDAEPKAILTNRCLLEHLPSGWELFLAEDLGSLLRDQPGSPIDSPAEDDSVATLIYTSGTTGKPKGAALTHSNLAVNAMTLNTCWQFGPSDRMLMALPLFHINGLANGLHTWLTTGFRVRLLERFRKEAFLDDFTDFQPTFFFGVPTIFTRLLEALPEAAKRIGDRARLFVSGSAPLPADTLARFRSLYGHTILERYGMTETLGVTANPYAGERRPGTVGKALPGMSVRLSGGDAGEVLVKGPTVFSGYWRNGEATKSAFTADGYFRTGDLAERSADGYYTLRGRRTELIISGGFNIYPQEIEDVLKQQPGVSDAAVIGEPDPLRGQRPVAFLVANTGQKPDPEMLRKECRRNLASYKTPHDFRFVSELPRNALGKIERQRLAAMTDTV